MSNNHPATSGTTQENSATVSDQDLNKEAKNSNSSQTYAVTHLSYPEDLLNVPDYGGNYVMFFINERQESKIAQDTSRILADVDPAVGRAINGAGFSNIAVLGSSFLTGAGAGGLIGGLLGGGGGGITKGAAALGTVSATTSGSLSTTEGLNIKALGKTFTKPLKRMKHAIALHMPNNFAIRSGAQYEEAETFMAQAFMQGVDVITEGATDVVKGMAEQQSGKDQIQGLVKTLTDGSAGVAQSAALQNVPGSEAIQAMAGVAPNPKKEQIFKNMDFRTFQYDYQFFPRSPEESNNIRNIVNTFKYHMHPEFKDSDGFLYTYPGEFEIYYYMGSNENPYVHKHTSAVLKEVNVNYTPQGQFTSFDNGAPTQINMTLSFQELSILTKGHLDAFGETPPGEVSSTETPEGEAP
jgi:hypothetical protein|tara:strand:+ start:34497 stop:35726 length:1230 start_codon:yes stop_codon:yes gene_type:complete